MKPAKIDQISELVAELAEDAVADLVVELIQDSADGAHVAASVLARYQKRVGDKARVRAFQRHNLQRFADIIRGRSPGRL